MQGIRNHNQKNKLKNITTLLLVIFIPVFMAFYLIETNTVLHDIVNIELMECSENTEGEQRHEYESEQELLNPHGTSTFNIYTGSYYSNLSRFWIDPHIDLHFPPPDKLSVYPIG